MDNKTIISPEHIKISGPLIFIAGPIIGADDWQTSAIKIIHDIEPDQWIASPRRKNPTENFIFEQQVDWETQYLRRAAKEGIIMFWLATEKMHVEGVDFAQATRFELAEWKLRHERDGVKIVVGIENGFHGAQYIKRRFFQDCPDVQFFSTLEDTCSAAVRLLK
jgi:hypothetical protein